MIRLKISREEQIELEEWLRDFIYILAWDSADMDEYGVVANDTIERIEKLQRIRILLGMDKYDWRKHLYISEEEWIYKQVEWAAEDRLHVQDQKKQIKELFDEKMISAEEAEWMLEGLEEEK